MPFFHTWLPNWELTLQDLEAGRGLHLPGYEKIRQTCAQATLDGLAYVWIDTCCIDKSSSAELSEAINSMFRWYAMASICYAFLEDVNTVPEGSSQDVPPFRQRFLRSRYFTRGWTLQELLAPKDVIFYDRTWNRLGSKHELGELVSDVTGIDQRFLQHRAPLQAASVAARMSWASKRQTTRVEDTAYCLIGIFDVYMPLIYGEGQDAFIRLQEAILDSHHDTSLLAWSHMSKGWPRSVNTLLATSPAVFEASRDVVAFPSTLLDHPFHITNIGLQLTLPVWKVARSEEGFAFVGSMAKLVSGTAKPGIPRFVEAYALSDCHKEDDYSRTFAIPVAPIQGPVWARPVGTDDNLSNLILLPWETRAEAEPMTLCLPFRRSHLHNMPIPGFRMHGFRALLLLPHKISVVSAVPEEHFDPITSLCTFPTGYTLKSGQLQGWTRLQYVDSVTGKFYTFELRFGMDMDGNPFMELDDEISSEEIGPRDHRSYENCASKTWENWGLKVVMNRETRMGAEIYVARMKLGGLSSL